MVKKIIEINNIGKFKNYKCSEISLQKLNALYSENGLGKTTLTSIFRSLSENNPKIIEGRRRLGESGKPGFKTEFHDGFIEFKDGNWTRTFNGMEICH